MALTIAPLTDYDSLVSLADADAYWAGMGEASWALATVANREAALRRGTQYILGRRILASAVDPVVLRPIREATSEAALRALNGKLYQDVGPAPVIEKTVGPITVRFGAAAYNGQIRIPIIDELLVGLTLTTDYGAIFSERV